MPTRCVVMIGYQLCGNVLGYFLPIFFHKTQSCMQRQCMMVAAMFAGVVVMLQLLVVAEAYPSDLMIPGDERNSTLNSSTINLTKSIRRHGAGIKKIVGKIGKKMKGNKSVFSLPLKVSGDPRNIFVTPVYVGTPEEGVMTDNEPFYVGFDSTSANSWIFGEVFDRTKRDNGLSFKNGAFFEKCDISDSAERSTMVPAKAKKNGSSGGRSLLLFGKKKKKKGGVKKDDGDDKEDKENRAVQKEILFSPTGRCNVRNYDSRASTTYKEYDPEKDDGIQDNPVVYEEFGDLASDTLKIGPKDIPGFKFLAVDKVGSNEPYRGAGFDGLLGLTTERNIIFPGSAIFHRMAGRRAKAVLKKPAFAFYVSPSGDTGEITFGGHNKALLAKGAKMKYFRQAPPKRYLPDWTLKFDSMRVGTGPAPKKGWGKKKPADPAAIMEKFNAMFVTTMPHAFMTNNQKYFDALPDYFKSESRVYTEDDDPMFKDNDMLIVDCAKRESMPGLELKIGKKLVVSFSAKEIFAREIVGNNDFKGKCASFFALKTLPPLETSDYGFDRYGLPVVTLGDVEWAIGTDFMKKYYVEFKIDWSFMSAFIGIGLSKGEELKYHEPLPSSPRSEASEGGGGGGG